MKIKEVLKEQRMERGMNQEELAEKILVSKKTISNWETGKTTPDLASILRLSELFNLSLDELIKGDEEVMTKIKKDTDTVSSNKKVVSIIFIWIVVYGLIFLSDSFFEIPKVIDPFVNSLFVILALTTGAYILVKSKYEIILSKFNTETLLNIFLLTGSAIALFTLSTLLNSLIIEKWQQNVIKVITTIAVAIIATKLFKRK